MDTGGRLNRSPSVPTPEGKYILVAAASSVRLYSAVTGVKVHTLIGHTREVTAVVPDHANTDTVGEKESTVALLRRTLLLYATRTRVVAGVYRLLGWNSEALELRFGPAAALHLSGRPYTEHGRSFNNERQPFCVAAELTPLDMCPKMVHLNIQVLPAGGNLAYLQCIWQAQHAGKAGSLL